MKTISEAAKNNVPIGEDSFFHYSDQDIWIEGFKKGVAVEELCQKCSFKSRFV